MSVFVWFLICAASGIYGHIVKRPGIHTVKRYNNTTSFRFAMVHDVLHQRFKKHSATWYKERIKISLKSISELSEKGDNYTLADLHVFDDIAVAHERLHQSAQGIEFLEVKRKYLLQLSEEPAPTFSFNDFTNILQSRFANYSSDTWDNYNPRDLSMSWYRYYANKGTLLIHQHMKAAISGDPSALKQLRTATTLIAKSICHNPQAHFGREIFQFVAINRLISFIQNPQYLREFSILGSTLDYQSTKGPPALRSSRIPDYDDPNDLDTKMLLRFIGKLDLDFFDALDVRTDTTYHLTVPFDEATLGILGMWVYGGGANPHFALALGTIMEQCGQRHLAWSAYRRAIDLGDRFWPDSNISEGLKQHCLIRMRFIEKYLNNAEQLEESFLHELQRGRDYQSAQVVYEEQLIAQGTVITDESFFDDFNRSSIASPIGNADLISIHRRNAPRIDLFFQHLYLALFIGSYLGLHYYRRLAQMNGTQQSLSLSHAYDTSFSCSFV